jgi:acyl carrier protein
MTEDYTKAKTREFLGKQIRADFDDDQDLFATGVLNSLFALQLVVFVEKEFQITVSNEDLDLENFKGVNAIAGFVARKLGKQAA